MTTNPYRSRRNLLLMAMFGVASVLAGPSAAQDKPKVRLITSAGEVVLELNPQKAPATVANFLQYVRDGHYDGTLFHRVIDGFMIQGGGFTAEFQQKATRSPIPLEAANGLKNDRGTIAMARTARPDSATAQFFINVANNDMLNAPNPDGHGYAVFGKVVQGMGTVDQIKGMATGNRGPHQNVPLSNVTILKATIEK